MFSWLSARRRTRNPSRPVPASWHRYLDANVALARRLPPERRHALLAWSQGFIAEVDWVGCGGLDVTEEMQVTIAAQAGLLVMGRPERDLYADVSSILVYPTTLVRPPRPLGFFEQPRAPTGHGTTVIGEAMLRGPVVLAWDAVLAGGRAGAPGNVVLHEFAHKLDMATGAIDGAPPLPTRREAARWAAVCTTAYARHQAETAAGLPTAIDAYGATSEAEFFAVATETYFLRPGALAAEHPALAAILDDYYRAELGPPALAVDDTPDGFALRWN